MAEIQFIPILKGITLGWLILYLVSTMISLTWYIQLCLFAGKSVSTAGIMVIIIILPFYLIIPFILAALTAARLCRENDFWINYKYYTVATIYGKKLAAERFGERAIFPSDYFTKVFKRFKFK